MEHYDPVTQSFPRIPSLLIYDELGRRRFPMGNPAYNERDMTYVWSQDNTKEIEEGIIKKADTVGELAEMFGLDGDRYVLNGAFVGANWRKHHDAQSSISACNDGRGRNDDTGSSILYLNSHGHGRARQDLQTLRRSQAELNAEGLPHG